MPELTDQQKEDLEILQKILDKYTVWLVDGAGYLIPLLANAIEFDSSSDLIIGDQSA